MQDIISRFSQIKRPKLLTQAARAGARVYRRDRHLMRVLGTEPLPRPGEALIQIMEREAELNQRRRSSAAEYSLSDHIETLIAMIGEAHLFCASRD